MSVKEPSDEILQLRLLYETSRRISSAVEIHDVVEAYLDQVAASGRYVCSVALYELDDSGERKGVVVRGSWSPSGGLIRGGERHPYSPDSLDLVLDGGATVAIDDVRQDSRVPPALRDIQVQSGRPALAMVPLMVRGIRVGLVLMSDAQPHHWEETELQPYQATAAQLAAAIDSRQQLQRLHDRDRQLAILEERQRLARELHDSVTQHLFSLTLIAQSIAPAWRRNPEQGEQRIERLIELSQGAQREMRRLLAELRPPVISGAAAPPDAIRNAGLATMLRQHTADLARDRWRVVFSASGYLPQPYEHEKALYLVGQEALHNVVKHARARTVRIQLGTHGGGVRLRVTDDGIGFLPDVPPDPTPGGHLGLASMRERMAVLGGRLRITSRPGKGTTVEASLPAQES